MFRKPGVKGWGCANIRVLCATWKLRLCWSMLFHVKNVQGLPERGLAVGRFQRGCLPCGVRTLDGEWGSPAPVGLSHTPPVGTVPTSCLSWQDQGRDGVGGGFPSCVVRNGAGPTTPPLPS